MNALLCSALAPLLLGAALAKSPKKAAAKPSGDDDADAVSQKAAPVRPGSIQAADLKEYDSLSSGRKQLIDEALKLAAGEQWLRYTYGSSDPASGGLDCSGSMYYLMIRLHIDPPRSSGEMFRWVKEGGKLTEVPATATALDDPAFDKLQPGDLLFWSGTTGGDDGTVSHVQMFLGHERKDNLAVMAGASDGRTYRGKRCDGYGVFDFKLPVAGSKARFLGYGPPPDLKTGDTTLASRDGDKPAAHEEAKDPPVPKKKTTTSKAKAKPKSATDDDDDRPATATAKKKKKH